MEHPDNPVATSARSVITHLRESVQSWMDSDRVLPADGSALLATLDQLREGLAGEDAPAAQAAMKSFIRRVQELMQAGLLVVGDHQPPMEAAAKLIAGLPGAGGIERETPSTTTTWIPVDASGDTVTCTQKSTVL
jgi:hypothetical protein